MRRRFIKSTADFSPIGLPQVSKTHLLKWFMLFFLFVHALFINTLRHAMYTFKITMGFEFLSEGEFLYFLCTCCFFTRNLWNIHMTVWNLKQKTRQNCRCMWNECSFRNELTPLCLPSPSFFQQPMNNLIFVCLSPFKTLYFKMTEITVWFIVLQLMWQVKFFSEYLEDISPNCA